MNKSLDKIFIMWYTYRMLLESIQSNFSQILKANNNQALCPYCKRVYELTPSNLSKMRTGGRGATYCSKKCSSFGRRIYAHTKENSSILYKCSQCSSVYENSDRRLFNFNFCSKECLNDNRIQNPKGNFQNICHCTNTKDTRAKCCKTCHNNTYWERINNLTLKDLVKQTKNKYSLNHKYTDVRLRAREYLKFHNIERKCKICDFNYIIEVCHIKPISSFSEDTLIGEINSLQNLVYLCPNHHAMLDKGIEPDLFKDLI